MRSKISLLFSLFFLVYFSGCRHKESGNKETTVVEKPLLPAPDFNPDTAYLFVDQQVKFGPRIPNSPPHSECARYIENKLREYGATVHVQNFKADNYDSQELSLSNIIGSYDKEKPKRILLAAHWDTRPFADRDKVNPTRPFDGANDGASGVGILLEIARVLSSNNHPGVGVDLVFFDGEDDGPPEFDDSDEGQNSTIWWCLGSQYWSKNPHVKNYTAYYGILLDMVGAKNAKFYKEGGSIQFAKKITDMVWNIAGRSGYSDYFIDGRSPGITDDHIFINQNLHIPTIDIIDYDPGNPDSYFPSYHHTHQDNMSIIDKNTLKAVGQTLLNVVYNESNNY